MSDALKRYMVELASDVSKLTNFMGDPSAAMNAAGLSAEDQAMLTGGDQGRLYAYLKGLPLPPASPQAPPPQMPTVVAAMNMPGAAAAVAPAQASMTPPPYLQALPQVWPQQPFAPIYYAAPWPCWPQR